MKNINKIIVIAVAAAATSLQAQVISWNVDDNGTISGANVAGLAPAANWNDSWIENGNAISPYGSPTAVNGLMDNTGTRTSLNIAYQAWGFWSVGSAPGQDADTTYNRNLLNGYLNAGPAGWNPPVTTSTITLTSVPYLQYDLYVYFSSDVAGRTGTISDGNITYDFSSVGPGETGGANALFTQTTDTGALYPTADYAIFSGETASSLTLTCSPLVSDAWLGIAGFQIVAVPEPGTLALAALGGVMLVLGRRSKSS
jgi:hypothetical protein